MNSIIAATRAGPTLRVFFIFLLIALLGATIYLLRNRKRFFSHHGDPNDTYAAANLRMWMVILILIHAVVITTIMIFEV